MFESLVKVYGMSHTDEELLRDYNNVNIFSDSGIVM